MKKWMFAATLFVAIAFSIASFGQKPAEQRAKKNVQMLTSKLSLTDEQQKTVYAAVLERMTKMDALKSDTAGGAKPDRKEMKATNQKFEATMSSTLNDEQKKKYEVMKAEMMENNKKKKGGE